MKKLINLIALVMLVSTNVLTPFSYANAEISGENPENAVEKAGETSSLPENQDEGGLEEKLPLIGDDENGNEPEQLKEENNGTADSSSDVHDEEPDETDEDNKDEESNEIEENEEPDESGESKEEDKGSEEGNTGEVAQILEESSEIEEVQEENMEEEVEDITLQKADESVVMEVISGTSGTLLPGTEFNVILKKLSGQSSTTFSTDNTVIKQIIQWTGDILPSGVTTGIISTTDSQQPIYAWYTGGIIYYVSNAEKIYMNPNSSYMFYNMKWITGLDVNNWDTSNVTSMGGMFGGCNSLTGLDLSNWNTSNVTNMSSMFQSCSNLTELNLSNWDTSKVTDMSDMFYYCNNLAELDVGNWNTSNVTNMNHMFYYCSNLAELDLSSFDTKNVTNMGTMFYGCNSLTKLDLSSFDTSNVTNMSSMFYGCRNLETIYASTGFATNKVTSYSNMFYNTTKLIGGNGTKFSSNSLTYAKVDTQTQSGYFTDKNAITARFISEGTIYENQSIKFGEKAIKPVTDPIKEGATFKNWLNSSRKEYDFENSKIERYTEIYASFNSSEATLLPGTEFNIILKKLSGQSSATHTTSNTAIKQIIQWTGSTIPSGVTTGIISLPYSDNDVIVWFKGGIIYYYTKAEKIYMNPDFSYMFNYLRGLTGLDISNWDTSKVTNMSNMFYYCNNLTELDISNWNTSNVTNMSNMFSNCSNLETIYASTGFITNKVTNYNNMFSNTTKLIGGNGTKFSSNSLTYAKVDTQSQSGYFTDKNAITARFISEGAIYENQSIKFGEKATKPVTNPIKEGATFKNWFDNSGEEYDFENRKIERYTEIYASFNSSEATLLPGTEFNIILKKLSGQSSATHTASNTAIKQIIQWTGNTIPSGVTTGIISLPYSDNDVIAWFSGGIIYYYTEAKTVYMNPDSSYMFNSMSGLTGLDLSNWNTSNVTNMGYMFYYCRNLTKLDISNWNTSNITNMYYMFYYCDNLTELDISNWNTSNVTNMSYMFSNCSNLETIYASTGFATNKVTSSSNMFSNTSKLIGGNGTKFDEDHVDINYAKTDTPTQSGYFTDKNIIKVDFIVYPDVFESYVVQLGGKATKPVTDPIKEGATFKNWINSSGEKYDFENSKIEKYTEIYAKFDSSGYTILLPGQEFNAILKKLSGQSNPTYSTNNTTIEQIIQWTGNTIPSGVTTGIISLPYSNNDVIAWFTGGVIYYYTDAETIYMNPNSHYMFSYMYGLTGLDLSNWDTSNVTNMSSMFYYCRDLTELNLSNWDTSKVTNMSNMFYYCRNLTELNLSNWNTSNVTNMYYMFYNCNNLAELNLSNWNTSKVTNMSSMFYNCNNLAELNLSGWNFRNVSNNNSDGLMYYLFGYYANGVKKLNMTNAVFGSNMHNAFYNMSNLENLILDGVDTSNVTDMYGMFQNCSKLTKLDLSSFNTSNVTNMSYMFYYCSSLTGLNLSGWNTSKVTNMNSIFGSCNKLEELNLNGWDFTYSFPIRSASNVKRLNMQNTKFSGSLQQAFNGLYKLKEINLSGADVSNVTNMSSMFQSCSNLTELNLSNWDVSNVTNMSSMFNGCNSLAELNLSNWNTNKVTNMWGMFQGCSNLTELDLSSFDTSNVTDMSQMFSRCSKLEKLNLDGWDFRKSGIGGGLLGNTSSLKFLSMSGCKIPQSFTNVMGRSWWNSSTIEEIDVSNWDLSLTMDINGLFGDMKALKTIKGLDTWDTSGITNMSYMFYNCSSLIGLNLSNFDTSKVTNMLSMFGGCSSLTGLNLSNWDTSNVTSMGGMFGGCSSLTGLDLSSFDTSNVTNMNNMFGSCDKLEEINLSGWDFRKYGNASLMMNIMYGTPQSLKKLNMTNTKYTGNATYAFGGLTKLEELNLDGADTSNVTNMNAMFNGDSNLKNLDLSSFDTSNVKDMAAMFMGCSSLTGLDLSSWDTSNVTNMPAVFLNCGGLVELDLSNWNTNKVTYMHSMFYGAQNLKTIYASDKFVTTALSGNNSSDMMFTGTISLIGGNGTKFDPNYIDKTYALIDKVGQTGYFTDKNSITVKFINTLDGTETISTFAKGQKITPPSVDKYHVAGGYLDEAMTQEIDLNNGVDSYSVIYVKYDRNGSSGGGGGGGGSSKDVTSNDSEKSTEQSTGSQVDPSVEPQNDNDVSSGANAKDPENTTPVDSSTSSQNDGKTYTQEFQQAYEFSRQNGITTMPSIQKAQMDGKLTRIAMAKMLSQYAINILGKAPDTTKKVKFKDVTNKMDKQYDNGVTLAYQLGIMGQNMKNNRFRPNDEVTRAEFATALSRLIYNTSDGEYKSTPKYYIHHMEKLVKERIITNDNPNMKELRGYVMIMLMRSAQ